MTARIIGHRGAAGHAPENTLASFRKAAELGVRWVEFDATLTSDSEIVLFHDATLMRTAGRPGRVAGTAWADLQKLDAGSWFSDDFAGEPIPTLRQTFDALAELGLGAVIEIKPSPGNGPETGRRVADTTAQQWPASLPAPILSSFDEGALIAARAAAPGIDRALNVTDIPPDWQDKLQALQCVALHCSHNKLTEKTVRAVIAAGYAVRGFTVNDGGRAETLFRWGVAGVFSDYPDRIRLGR